MTKLDVNEVTDDWWPSALLKFADEDPLAVDFVVVAEISKPWGEYSDKLLYTCLVPKDRVPALLDHRGCIGYQAESSGPYPLPFGDQFCYEPAFYIYGLNSGEHFEPLIVRWQSAGKTILLPDHGFLMTYGLMPRYCESGETIWDDPQNRVFDVVRVEPPSKFFYRLISDSRVLIRREYLQDYATVRDMSIIQVYFVANSSDTPDPTSSALAKNKTPDIILPQRRIDVRVDARDRKSILTQIWGYRHLLDPGKAPVSKDDDYGILDWPGYGVIDGSKGMLLGQLAPVYEYVYVRDTVLVEYEGLPEFDITPESGAVSYGGQWSVSNTNRLGRNLIQVELKKLYEGNTPRTVKTWYKYCVEPPVSENFSTLSQESNIAKRAKAVVYAMVELGEILAEIVSRTTGTILTGRDLVSLNRAELDYKGWWKNTQIEPITRHAPLEMKEDEFLGRCIELFKVVGEGLSERDLRKTLRGIGIAEDDIKNLRSLKLLELLIQLAIVAKNTGLNLFTDGREMENRRRTNILCTPVKILLDVRILRNSKSHRTRNTKQALKNLGIFVQKMESGWGEALDIVYDRIAEALVEIRNILQDGMDNR